MLEVCNFIAIVCVFLSFVLFAFQVFGSFVKTQYTGMYWLKFRIIIFVLDFPRKHRLPFQKILPALRWVHPHHPSAPRWLDQELDSRGKQVFCSI
uniref:Uncharacterized protein n=1 Tax=Cercocebus atys TaxID=9531 RepID=A0A2K5KZA7_CERAT